MIVYELPELASSLSKVFSRGECPSANGADTHDLFSYNY